MRRIICLLNLIVWVRERRFWGWDDWDFIGDERGSKCKICSWGWVFRNKRKVEWIDGIIWMGYIWIVEFKRGVWGIRKGIR